MRTVVCVFVSLFLLQAIADHGETYFSNYIHQGKIYDKIVLGAKGNVKFFTGEHFSLYSGAPHNYIHQEFKSILNLAGTEIFQVKRQEVDRMGNSHIVLSQFNRGLEVDGGEIILHVYANNSLFAVTSSVLSDFIEEKPLLTLQPKYIIRSALNVQSQFIKTQFTLSKIELVYLLFNDEGFLAYRAVATYQEEGLNKNIDVYIDANDGKLILENPQWRNALNRIVYSANETEILPGILERYENQSPSNDPAVNQAYNNSGICYNYFFKTFNRDSIDGKGLNLSSTVHFGINYNNAFWDGTSMVYGDGDGVSFANFQNDLSVVCHELTHAVTSYTADLRYEGESGALNEAMSDIFGASSTVFRDGGINVHTWHIGWECYLAGEALRYMNNPILDGASYDWYPTRYTGRYDNGGVHWNSGIANLAYVLMTQGGVHPQQKSTIWVDEVGIDVSQQVIYSALAHYMTSTTTFAGARAATETAAKVLYGPSVVTSVANAWTAVGVSF